MIMEAYSSNRFHQKCVSKQLAISESDHGSVVFHAVCWCVRQQLATVLCCKYSIFFFQQGTVQRVVLHLKKSSSCATLCLSLSDSTEKTVSLLVEVIGVHTVPKFTISFARCGSSSDE